MKEEGSKDGLFLIDLVLDPTAFVFILGKL